MTLEEAKLKAKEINDSAMLPFCPLIATQCTKGCVCWQEAAVDESIGSLKGDKVYGVTWVGCTNAMFTGNRECNQNY